MKRLFVAVIAVGLIATACGASVEDAKAAYCEDLGGLFDALFAAQELTPNSSVDEAQEAANAVRSAYDDVVASAEEYTEAQISEIETARAGFEDAVGQIPDSATLGEVQAAIQSAIEVYFEAVGPALDAQCPPSDG